MRYGLRKDIDWEYMGALLAKEGDNNQVAFFRGFVEECKSWGTYLQIETQLSYINLKLTPEERKTLSMLGYEEGKVK